MKKNSFRTLILVFSFLTAAPVLAQSGTSSDSSGSSDRETSSEQGTGFRPAPPGAGMAAESDRNPDPMRSPGSRAGSAGTVSDSYRSNGDDDNGDDDQDDS